MGGKYIPSILAAIGSMEAGGALKADPHAVEPTIKPRGPACPKCGQYALRMQEGCMTCGECGYSKCG